MSKIPKTDKVKSLRLNGLYEKIINFKSRCDVCGKLITIDNIGTVFKEQGHRNKATGVTYIACNNPDCGVADPRDIFIKKHS